MRKIVAGLFISLDGVVEAPERWHFPYFNDEMGAAVGAQMAAADTLLVGRRTYEEFAGHFAGKGDDDRVAAQMNNVQKLVASTTLDTVDWQNSSLIKGDVVEELAALKQRPGRNISISGSATLVRSLIRGNVLDELWLLLHPIVVGQGKRLFEDGLGNQPLELIGSTTFSTGVLSLAYRPVSG
jgi:dihydrofolate reductase